MKLKFKYRRPNPYSTKDELYICTGGVFRKGVQMLSDSVMISECIQEVTGKPYTAGSKSRAWEEKTIKQWWKKQYAAIGDTTGLCEWYHDLKPRSNYRIRAGIKDGEIWADLCIEFLYFSDFTTRRGKYTLWEPGVTHYWLALDEAMGTQDASWEVIIKEPANELRFFPDIPATQEGIERVAKMHAGQQGLACIIPEPCVLGKSKLCPAFFGPNHGRAQWQIEARIPLTSPLRCDLDYLDDLFEDFIGDISSDYCNSVQPEDEATEKIIRNAIASTVVNVV